VLKTQICVTRPQCVKCFDVAWDLCGELKKKSFIMDPRGGESKCLLIDFKCPSMPVSCVFMCMRNFCHRHVCTTRHCNAATSRLKGSKTFFIWPQALGLHRLFALNHSENDSEINLINYTFRAQQCGRTLSFPSAYVDNEALLDYH